MALLSCELRVKKGKKFQIRLEIRSELSRLHCSSDQLKKKKSKDFSFFRIFNDRVLEAFPY